MDHEAVNFGPRPLERRQQCNRGLELALGGTLTAVDRELVGEVPPEEPGPEPIAVPLGEADPRAESRLTGAGPAERVLRPRKCVPG
jgi:hypothetical protein